MTHTYIDVSNIYEMFFFIKNIYVFFKRLRELVRRSQARLQAIQSASIRRARITAQMKNLVIYELNNSEYFDIATYDSLHSRLKDIEAFPFEQMKNDTIR